MYPTLVRLLYESRLCKVIRGLVALVRGSYSCWSMKLEPNGVDPRATMEFAVRFSDVIDVTFANILKMMLVSALLPRFLVQGCIGK